MMKTQRGSTLIAVVLVAAVFAVFAIVAAVGFVSYVSAYNYGNRMETQLFAVQEDNRNKLAQYGQKVLEVTQVPEMYKDDTVKVVKAAIEGRYGPDGSKAVFQMLTEQNPSLDPAMYIQIQRVIEAGRNDFQAGQTRQIDIKRQYKERLGTFWGGMWLSVAGYPKTDLAQFDIVSTDRADEAFKNKREDGPIQLRQSAQ